MAAAGLGQNMEVKEKKKREYMYVCIYNKNKENQKGVNEIKNKTPKKYSQPSSNGHREYRVRMTFLVSVSIKLKIQTGKNILVKGYTGR